MTKMFTPHKRVQMHILKQHAPSNLNRDDSGAPKMANFAGTDRLRISSQCLKHSMRLGATFAKLRNKLDSYEATRTRRLFERLMNEGNSKEVSAVAAGIMYSMCMKNGKFAVSLTKEDKTHGLKALLDDTSKQAAKKESAVVSSKAGRVAFCDLSLLDSERLSIVAEDMFERGWSGSQLVSLSMSEVENLLNMLNTSYEEDSEPGWGTRAVSDIVKTIKSKESRNDLSVDIALFGRMITGDGLFGDVDSCIQVAHSITTRPALIDVDYWSAADDFTEASTDTGSGHLGERPFGSGMFYSYVNIDTTALSENLINSGFSENDIPDIVKDIVSSVMIALCTENPTGYQNSFASHPLASKLITHVGDGSPFSAATAFADFDANKPESDDAVERLVAWRDNCEEQYGDILGGQFVCEDTVKDTLKTTVGLV